MSTKSKRSGKKQGGAPVDFNAMFNRMMRQKRQQRRDGDGVPLRLPRLARDVSEDVAFTGESVRGFSLQCPFCEFSGQNRAGLSRHLTWKHHGVKR